MIETIELNSLDRRYEHLRLKDKRREHILLSSVLEQGILDPLYVISLSDSRHVLLDGFKRYRCAVKLSLPVVPVVVLDNNEAMGILKLIRLSGSKGLSSLEEASLVDELHHGHGMSVVEISRRLERSISWVSVRLGILRDMSEAVRKKIFAGEFPVRNYLYSLRHFTRVKDRRRKEEVDCFVCCVSGKGLSTRDIDLLAGAWFKGGEVLKSQIENGNIDWTLRQLKAADTEQDSNGDNLKDNVEARVLRNLEIVYAIIHKLSYSLKETRFINGDIYTRSHKMVRNILNIMDCFKDTLQEFHDTTRQKTDGSCVVRVGKT